MAVSKAVGKGSVQKSGGPSVKRRGRSKSRALIDEEIDDRGGVGPSYGALVCEVQSYAEVTSRERRKSLVKPLLLFLGLIVVLLLLSYFGVAGQIKDMQHSVHKLGPAGPILFVFIFAVLVVLVVPGSVLTVVAAALFGPWLGIVVDSLGCTLGAALAFLISRYVARDAIAHNLARFKWFQKMEDLTETYDALVVGFVRLIPIIPFNFSNYAFGLTKVKFKNFVLFTWLGMLVPIVLYVVGANLIIMIFLKGEFSPRMIPMIGVLVIFLVIMFFAVRYMKNKMSPPKEDQGQDEGGDCKTEGRDEGQVERVQGSRGEMESPEK